MITKRIGNIGEAKTLAKFVEHGIPVYLPFGDTESEDLIVKISGKLLKVQVKTSQITKSGKMEFSLTSSTVHRKNGHKKFYSSSEVDLFACYNIERDILLLVPFDVVKGKHTISIRFRPAKNGAEKGYHMEEDFLFETVLKQLQN